MGNVAFDAGIFGTIGTNYPEGPIFQILFFKLIIRSLSVFTVCIDRVSGVVIQRRLCFIDCEDLSTGRRSCLFRLTSGLQL